MRIYVVKPGDSVFSISRAFGVQPQDIFRANGITTSTRLVVGQSLIVPSRERSYRVQPGDTVWSIARKFNVTVESIAELNSLSPPYTLSPGTVIRIPEKANRYGFIEVNAFIQPSNPERERRVLNEAAPHLTYVAPFSYHINQEGGLIPIEDATTLQVARANRVAPLLSVSNISGANFDTGLISRILNSTQLQQTLINNIETTMTNKGYYGVIIDFERIPPADRQKYNDFLRRLVTALHPRHIVGVALAPKTYDVSGGAWHGAHDYRAIGAIVDFVVIMTYEWGWSGGPPMAVAPLNEVRKVINYAVSTMPPKKILMGMPFYGYDWTLPYEPGGEFAESIGNQEAINRAGRVGARIEYDEKAQSPFYRYRDAQRREHVVWFEDARSIEAKLKLASQYGLRGVSYWALGRPFPQNWEVLDDMFKITKVVR